MTLDAANLRPTIPRGDRRNSHTSRASNLPSFRMSQISLYYWATNCQAFLADIQYEKKPGSKMEWAIPLDKMTISDKLRVLEQIWTDLQQQADDVPSPSWHADVLQAREERIRNGHSKFSDLSEAKRRIRESIR